MALSTLRIFADYTCSAAPAHEPVFVRRGGGQTPARSCPPLIVEQAVANMRKTECKEFSFAIPIRRPGMPGPIPMAA
jgi:hypothetical protein